MEDQRRNREWYWVSHLQMIRMDRLNCLIDQMEDPEQIMMLTDRELNSLEQLSESEKKIIRIHRDNRSMILESYEQLSRLGLRYISFEDGEYPKRLRELPDRPVGLFVKGRLPDNGVPCVAIVGARACSSYGRDCASYFGQALSRAGVPIISGMAYGIDSTAQKAAVKEKGSSYAVLGGGADICYPKECFELYQELAAHGGVVSEMLPGTQGRPWMFTRRNRIISGMSEAVIVVEARERSGSLITANDAAEQGRLVYAVPGQIDSALSSGCHELIQNGAILLQKPQEILDDLKMTLEANLESAFSAGHVKLSEEERDVYMHLGREPVHLEQLLAWTAYPAGMLMNLLLQLEIKGYACQNPQNYYRKTRLVPPDICVK